MNIFPAIDLYDGKAVRLFKGDYNQMTVYNENPLEVAKDFENAGAKFIHLVDLEGAKFGTTPNIEVIKKIVDNTNLFTEIGGGIRSIETVDTYLNAGLDRVIIGTAAVTDEEFLKTASKNCLLPISHSVKILSEKSDDCRIIAMAESRACDTQATFCKFSGEPRQDFVRKLIKL